MSVTIRHLNADSTFLLIFSPNTKPTPSDLRAANNAYSVLIDPWITGPSIINARWFAITDRLEPSAINHMADIEEPDVVIVSQNKPDHCHKETLLQLRPEGKTIIAAEPGAAKAIKSWNHFDPNRIYGLDKYDAKAKFGSTLRLRIPPLSPEGLPGEVTIAFIPARNYMTGLHNAFGITYQAPTRSPGLACVPTLDLAQLKDWPLAPASLIQTAPVRSSASFADRDLVHDRTVTGKKSMPDLSSRSRPKSGHRPRLSHASNTASSDLLTFDVPSVRSSHDESCRPQHLQYRLSSSLSKFDFGNNTYFGSIDAVQALPTPPQSPKRLQKKSRHSRDGSNTSSTLTPKHSTSSASTSEFTPRTTIGSPSFIPPKPKTISILYTPHGIPLSDLQPYIKTHLVPRPGSLPLTALLHSFSYAQNPWYLGGNIMAGAPNGVHIARALMARTWISAHDEDKVDRGVAVKLLKTRQIPPEEVRRRLAAEEGNTGWSCDVRTLDIGREIVLSSDFRDLSPITTRDVKHGRGSSVGLGLSRVGTGCQSDILSAATYESRHTT